MRASRPVLLAVALSFCLAASPLPAREDPRAFVLSGDYVVELDGIELEDAELFRSAPLAAYLVRSGALRSPILLTPMSGTFARVDATEIVELKTGGLLLGADRFPDPDGRYKLEGRELAFELSEGSVRLKPPAWLVGSLTVDQIEGYLPDYRRDGGFEPRVNHLRHLEAEERKLKVQFFFASWSSESTRLMPRLLALSRALDGSPVSIEYYGLPSPISSDRLAERMQIRGVPTAVVYLDRQEIGRLAGDDLERPEVGIHRLVCAY